MSETVKRYIGAETVAAGKARWGNYADLECPDGDFVRYSDYAKLEAKLAPSAWRSMEDAPKQGSILLYTSGEHGHEGRWWDDGRGWRFRGIESTPIEPTAWMPLPPPPNAEEASR